MNMYLLAKRILMILSYEFTQQKKIVKPKIKPILTNGENSTSSEKKSQLVK